MTTPIVVRIDPDLWALIPGYLANRQHDLARLPSLLEAADWLALAFIGHGMKGSGGSYGFDAISEYGARIERAAQTAQGDVVRGVAAELADYLARVDTLPDT